jgi:ribosomal protein S18 acetylase RimI-like enzyme
MLHRIIIDRVHELLAAAITLRPASADNEPFLYRVYANVRGDELAHLNWDQAQKNGLLEMQFAAQSRSYRENFPGSGYDLILLDQVPVGRLYLHVSGAEIRVVDIGLLSEYRNRGIGSEIMRAVQAVAAEGGRPVRLTVACSNRAARFYERLGFMPMQTRGIHIEMEWAPGSTPQSQVRAHGEFSC